MKSQIYLRAGKYFDWFACGRRFPLSFRGLALLAIASLAQGCMSIGSIGNEVCDGAVQTRLGCITAPENSAAGSTTNVQTEFSEAYEERVEALVANHLAKDRLPAPGIGVNHDDNSRFENPEIWRSRQRLNAAADRVRDGAPALLPAKWNGPGEHKFNKPWRKASAFLYIDSPKKADPPGRFAFSGIQALETTVFLRSITKAPLNAAIVCDGRAILQTATARKALEPGKTARFSLLSKERDTSKVIIPDATNNCVLDVLGAAGGAARRITIEREEDAYTSLADIDSRYEVCAVPASGGMTALESAFFSDSWLSKGCTEPLGNVRLIPDSRDGFNA